MTSTGLTLRLQCASDSLSTLQGSCCILTRCNRRAHIALAQVRAHAIRIRSHNGAISGHFNVSRSLSLASSNGAIRAKVALFPRTKEDDDLPDLPPNPPSDGVPSPPKDVGATAGHKSKEATTVHATTTNGAVDVEYIEHPTGQILYSYAASTNGKVAVTHPPAYEVSIITMSCCVQRLTSPRAAQGDFEAETTWGTATISGPDDETDPSGKGRKRSKEVRTDRKELGYRHIVGSTSASRSHLLRRLRGVLTTFASVAVWWSEKGKDDDRRERGETSVRLG